MATTSPDSLAAGRAYQQQLLALLGQDDPAEVAQATASAVQSLLKEAGSNLSTRPAPGELSVFSALRAANLRLWRRSTAEDRERVAIHSERGPESYGLMFRMLAGHDRFHLHQMRETLRLLR